MWAGSVGFVVFFFFFQAEDGIRDLTVTGVQTCALPISLLEAVGLLPRIGVVVSAEEVPRGKPHPDVFEEAARRLGVPAHECVVIEDSRHGVEAAKRAFMRCIAVPYLTEQPLPGRFGMADLLFDGGMQSFDADAAFRWIEERLAG